MRIDINKNFEKEYKPNVWRGFSGRETATIAVSAGIAIALIALFWGKLHWEPMLAGYVAVFGVAPVILLGFWRSRTGLSLIEKIKASLYVDNTAKLKWESEEYEMAVRECEEKEQEWRNAVQEQVKALEKEKKRFRRNQK